MGGWGTGTRRGAGRWGGICPGLVGKIYVIVRSWLLALGCQFAGVVDQFDHGEFRVVAPAPFANSDYASIPSITVFVTLSKLFK